MISLYQFMSPIGPCGYRPEERWSLQYDVVFHATADEYQERLERGWRRFGHSLFRPACPRCQSCISLRVPSASFRPDRSQRRAWQANADVRLEIGEPTVSPEKLDLYDRFHAYQADAKGWREHGPKDPAEYADSFVVNPFPTEEWCYYLGERLVGVGYVDALPDALSAIYFYHDPDERHRSLGTFNVLKILQEAAARGVPHVYLGYYVEGCRSLEYKARFQPNECLTPNGSWIPFQTRERPTR